MFRVKDAIYNFVNTVSNTLENRWCSTVLLACYKNYTILPVARDLYRLMFVTSISLLSIIACRMMQK